MTRFGITSGRTLLVLLLLNSALAAVLGFFALTPDQSLRVVIHGGYWAMLVITVLFGRSIWRIARESFPGWAELRARPRWPAALIGGCGLLLLVHEGYGFKILMDEIMLLGTSMSMHLDKTALVPMRGHDLLGAFQLLAGQLDKRPLFQPFLVTMLHDLTGYRPENVFALNTVLTFVLLTLAYLTGGRLGGRGGGAITVLLLTTLPLLAQNATGGGFEILNLVMILATLLLGMRFVERRDGASLEAMVLAAILLAQTRYESVLFLLPAGLAVAWVWWSGRAAFVTPVVACSPLFLLPYALQNQVFSVRASSWELGSQPGFDRPFAFSYIPDNFQHWMNFFFDTTGGHSNSLVIAVLGFLAAPFLMLAVAKILPRLRDEPPSRVAFALFNVGFAAHTLLMLCYFWGRFDDPVIRRLSLPLNLFLVLAVVAVAAEIGRGAPAVWRVLALATGIGMFAHSLPAMARHDYTWDYYVGREMEWRREFIAAHPDRDYLVIDNNSIIWVTHLVSGTPVKQALDQKNNIIFNLQNHTYTAIYAFQRCNVDPQTGRITVQPEDDLGPDYELATHWERRFTPLTVSRLSRVVSVRGGPTTPPERVVPAIDKLTPEEREKARQAYFSEFVKRLP